MRCQKHSVTWCHQCRGPGTIWLADEDPQTAYPDDNPKTAVGSTKVPLHLVPPSAKHVLAEAMADGAKKYGPYNWREKRVSATTYVAAALRHIEAYLDGEDVAPDSLVHHVGHGMACLAILYDALTIGMLNDDRPTKGASPRLQQEYAARHAKPAVSAAEPIDLAAALTDIEAKIAATNRNGLNARIAAVRAQYNFPRPDTGD